MPGDLPWCPSGPSYLRLHIHPLVIFALCPNNRRPRAGGQRTAAGHGACGGVAECADGQGRGRHQRHACQLGVAGAGPAANAVRATIAAWIHDGLTCTALRQLVSLPAPDPHAWHSAHANPLRTHSGQPPGLLPPFTDIGNNASPVLLFLATPSLFE